jgi:phage repressor protein C with HTH and peptisase S24 domain
VERIINSINRNKLGTNKKAEEIISEARKKKGWTQAEAAEQLAAALNQTYSQRQYQKLEEGNFPKYKTHIITALETILGIKIYELIYAHNVPFLHDDDESKYNLAMSPAYGKPTIRKPKTEVDPEKEGIRFVSIAAQAGYSRKITEPIFERQLEKLYIPGFPYRGDRYQVWEIEGNSMEPKFKEHFHVLSERVEPEYWATIKEFYVYVVVTEEGVLIKRIKRSKQPGHWVMISDNKTLYEPFLMPIELVKELWLVKRKMDWEMSPPERFEIDM